MILLKTDWTDFYKGISINHSFYNFNIETEKKDFIGPLALHVKNCFFHRTSSSTYSGAIYIESNSGESLILIEKSMFIECSGEYGGAISAKGNNQCVLSRLCSDKCTAYHEPFDLIYVTESNQPKKNFILETSVSKAYSETHGCTIDHHNNII